jgi:NADPH:quinone reductase-like Zn-dependent oxidoreductase
MSHSAALFHKPGSRLEITSRPTPTPGPKEILIEVHSIALNPIDHYVRDYGMPPVCSPAVLGSDIAGVIISIGSSVSSSALKPGTRVTAFCPSFYEQGKPDYGAFQKLALVPEELVCPLPQAVSFNEGAVLPMSVLTAFIGLNFQNGIPYGDKFSTVKKKGILVWSAASSVGTAVVQIAKSMGFTVYATASEKNHAYVKMLGASKVFDYSKEDVVVSIAQTAKADGVTLNMGYMAAGSLKTVMEALAESKASGVAKLASAPLLPENVPSVEGVEVQFVKSSDDLKERMEHHGWVFGVWLKEKLENGEYVPSPRIKVVDGGFKGLDKGLDELAAGVSGVKLVLEV